MKIKAGLWVVISLALSGAGCATSSFEGERAIAAEESGLRFGRDELRDPGRAIVERLKRLRNAHLVGYAALRGFDEHLDRGGADPMRSEHYARLLAIWEAKARIESEVESLYRFVLNDPEGSARAAKTVRDYLSSETAAGKFAVWDTVERLRRSGFALTKKLKAGSGLETLERVEEDFSRQTPEIENELKENSEKVAKVDPELVAEIQRRGQEIFEALNQESSRQPYGRIPQSSSIYPSTGKNGNVDGRGFPENTWSLTFDDGPVPSHTTKVLSALAERKMKATFFILGKNLKAYTETAKAQQAFGMELASHSYSHPQLPKQSDATLIKEIAGTSQLFDELLGERPRFFRCPYGAGVGTSRVRELIAQEGMIHVFWTVDTLDWQDKNPQSILARTIKQMNASKGGVILFHDIHPQSVEASRMVMDELIARKSRVVTLGEIVDEINGNAKIRIR